MPDDAIKRAERRKLHVGLGQGLDRKVDQIGRVAHGQRCRADHGGDDGFTAITVTANAQLGADMIALAGKRVRSDPAIDQTRRSRKIQGRTQECDDLLGHLVQQREAAELMQRLEHDEKRQSLLITVILPKHQLCFLDGRAEASVELLVAELLGEARIGGALDRGHGCCALQSGVRKTPVKSADLRLGISGAYARAAEGTKTNCFWYTLSRMNKRVAIYARVSTGEQTPDNQLQELRAVDERMDWHVDAEYIDHGISGAKGREQRPGYDQLYDAIVRREVDLVMAWSVDRLGRSLQQPVALLSDLQAKGVDLYLHQQGIDTTTAAGKAMFQMCGVFAEFERAMIRERVRAGLERARAQGKILGRPHTPEIVEERIRAARLQGNGIKKIATELGIGVSTVQRVVHGPTPNPVP